MNALSPNSKPKFDRVITVEDSSVITGVRYDPRTRVLDVRFKHGRIYRYRNVSTFTFAEFVVSKSPGAYYNAAIKGMISRKLPASALWA